ncbi:MAG: SAM-dependent chlorinase/fluorinase [Phycisphaerae bacterium]|nr:SAM-dependent chlorinase/fluorinase [Phycisphaerae bacterium]
MRIITLTTDFGEADHYIACMKGVILQHAPTVHIVDVTHVIQPHDVVHGAFVLRQIFDHFPEGTIHIAVVDPGVGTARRLLAVRYEDQIVLAPDNGLVSLIHRDFAMDELRAIENTRLFRQEISATFHGRDVLAPLAGHLAEGLALENVGPVIDQLEILNLERPMPLPDGGMEGQVLYVDRFGNMVSNISHVDLDVVAPANTRALNVHVGPLRVGPLKTTYADVAPGEIVAIIGSTGMLEIAINQGNAAAQLRAAPGTIVVVR